MQNVDCTKTVDYLTTRALATNLDENGYCRIHCDDCILKNQTITKRCEVLEYLHPDDAIRIMQAYADEQLNAE